MIRKLEITDYPKINKLLGQLTESPDISNQKFIEQFNKLKENDLHLVIEKEGKIIGYGAIIIDYKFYRNCKNVGHIEDIVIDTNERGNGLAKKIINKLIEYGKNQNCYKFILSCKDEYINFYRKYNFEKKNNMMVKYFL